MSRTLVVGSSLLALVLAAPPVHADAEGCAKSYERAQSLRQDAKLLEARSELLVCAQDACPAVLRKDCVTWLSEVTAQTPSIAVRVHGKDGCDRPDAQITLDGTLVPRGAEGRPIAVNPGSHSVQALVDGATADQVVVATTADKTRLVTIELGDPQTTCGRPSNTSSASSAPPFGADGVPSPERRGPTTLTYALGTAGIITGAVAISFGISAWSQKGTLDDCKGTCAQRDVDTMRRTFLIADVATFVTVATLAAATVLYLTR
jgi:hypothetical protein